MSDKNLKQQKPSDGNSRSSAASVRQQLKQLLIGIEAERIDELLEKEPKYFYAYGKAISDAIKSLQGQVKVLQFVCDGYEKMINNR